MSKKLGIGIALGIVFVLVISIIIASAVKINYLPNINNPDQIYFKNQPITKEGSSETYDKLFTSFQDSFKRDSLSSLFAGQKGDDKAKTIDSKAFDKIEMNGYVLKFKYKNETQNLEFENTKIGYNEIIVNVTNSTQFENVDIYFKQVSSSSSTYYYVYSTFAKYDGLFETLKEIEETMPGLNS